MLKIAKSFSRQASRFCFPVKRLESEDICLVPFEASTHAAFFKDSLSDPGMYAHFSSGPYNSLDHFVEALFTQRSYKKEDMLTYAIYEREKRAAGLVHGAERGIVAGMISLVNVDVENRSAEIGILQILPLCRSRGLATKAGRLLAWYGLLPAQLGGMGLVRMEWRVSSGNSASLNVAQKLGFREVGLIKYERLLKNGVERGKVGNGRPNPLGTSEKDLWRDVSIHELSWDDWLPSPLCADFRSLDIDIKI